jgi:hypothetical protein
MKQRWFVGPFALALMACAAAPTLSPVPTQGEGPSSPKTDAPQAPPAAGVPQAPAEAGAPQAPVAAGVALAPAAAGVPPAAAPPTLQTPVLEGRGLIDPALIVVNDTQGQVQVSGQPHAVIGRVKSLSITVYHHTTDPVMDALAGRAGQDTILGSVIQALEPDGSFKVAIVRARVGEIAHGEHVTLLPQGELAPNIGPALTLLVP